MLGLFLKISNHLHYFGNINIFTATTGPWSVLNPGIPHALSVLRFWGRPHPLDLFLEHCAVPHRGAPGSHGSSEIQM